MSYNLSFRRKFVFFCFLITFLSSDNHVRSKAGKSLPSKLILAVQGVSSLTSFESDSAVYYLVLTSGRDKEKNYFSLAKQYQDDELSVTNGLQLGSVGIQAPYW